MKMIRAVPLLLLVLLLLTACGTAEEPETEAGYILSHVAALPEDITGVSRVLLRGDKLLLCCAEEADGENAATYAASINLDGSGFEKLPLALAGNEKLLDIAPDGKAGLWSLVEIRTDEENSSYVLRRYDGAGAATGESSLDKLLNDRRLLRPGLSLSLRADGEGRLCVAVYYSKTACFLFDSQGEGLFTLSTPGSSNAVVADSAGQLYVCASEDGAWTYSLLPIDMDKQDWGKRTSLGSASAVFDGDRDASYFLYDSSFLYAVDGAGERTELFNWPDLGLDSGDCHLCPLPDGRFAAVTGASSQTRLLSYEFCTVEPGVDERTVLSMVSLRPDSSILAAVSHFNKTNTEYKVELRSFYAANEDVSAEDMDKAITRFNTELITGKVPDILDLNDMPVDVYSS